MTPNAFELLRKAETSWWYEGRRRIVQSALRHVSTPPGRVLDFGAGYGGMCEVLSVYGEVFAFEPFVDGATACAKRGYARVFRSRDEFSTFRSSFALCAAFDVVEHVQDDRAAVRDIADLLMDKGICVLTVPAYQWLWGEHDVSHKHFRRYTTDGLQRVVESEGLRVMYIGHWNCFLFPPFLFLRLLKRGGEGAFHLPKLIQELLLCILRIEAWLVSRVRLPFGSSIICVAMKCS